MATLDDLLGQVDAVYDDIIRLEQDLVRIPSVNTGFMPTGGETEVCDFVREWLAGDGIECLVLERVPGRGNLIANLEGASGRPGLMFMSHTDVVPVEDETKWRFPPFGATISGGRIYGRGASDCKGLLTAHLIAMRVLKRSGVRLRDGLILASGADEEHGGRYGFGWLAEHHPEKITAPFAVNEGGGTPLEAAGGLAYGLGVGEKGRLQVEIDFKGVTQDGRPHSKQSNGRAGPSPPSPQRRGVRWVQTGHMGNTLGEDGAIPSGGMCCPGNRRIRNQEGIKSISLNDGMEGE